MTERKIIYELKNEAPIELRLLTVSLAAFSDQFKRYVADSSGIDSETRLFVHEIRAGSVIAELVALGQLAADLYEQRDAIAGFVPLLQDITEQILRLAPESRKLDRATIKNVSNIYAPIAIDPGAQLNVIDNTNGVINNFFTVSPTDAAAIAHNAHHLLNSELPDEERFTNEPMTLFQMRDAPPGKTGDYGIVDRFSPKPRKLLFASEAIKVSVLHPDGNPFEKVFWVDGVVKTASGSIAGYLVQALTDVTDRET